LFAISFHESAHAWTANRCGDPTARMLGRITLNPIKHIDPVGTVLLPLIALVTGIPVLGWAKPTPVNPHNFKNKVADDILTAVAGPVSNFLVASSALLVLAIISLTSPLGRGITHVIPVVYPNHLEVLAAQTDSALMPLSLLAYELMVINIVLGVFNLIPVPPLDGSHVLKLLLPPTASMRYSQLYALGFIPILLVMWLLPGVVNAFMWPVYAMLDVAHSIVFPFILSGGWLSS